MDMSLGLRETYRTLSDRSCYLCSATACHTLCASRWLTLLASCLGLFPHVVSVARSFCLGLGTRAYRWVSACTRAGGLLARLVVGPRSL